MSRCQFTLADATSIPPLYRCACGNQIRSHMPQDTLLAKCRVRAPKVAPLPCVHLGPEVRRVACESCRGSVQIKVFACAIHGECTARRYKSGGNMRACLTCAEYFSG